MANRVSGSKTLENDQDIVVFIIGARINKWWLLPFALPILSKMRRMLNELLADPESGLLSLQSLGFADIQYWRSRKHLLDYAADRQKQHRPTAKKFYQKLFKNEAVGVWHEAYAVAAGNYECLYTNMPRVGLGKAMELVDASGQRATAKGRFAAGRAGSKVAA